MHKKEFIFREIQEKLGNDCRDYEAEMVFDYAREFGFVDSNWEGDWFWTAKVDENFTNNDNIIQELYRNAVINLAKHSH